MLNPEKYREDAITGCLIWTGSVNKKGYGRVRRGRKVHLAHKYVWESINGPVPQGRVLDHFKCDTPACFNPDHVRPVTNRENVLRGRASKALSICGHPLEQMSDARRCRLCRNAYHRRLMSNKNEVR